MFTSGSATMAVENTPLSEAFTTRVQGIVLNPENASAAATRAGNYAKEQAAEIQELAREGAFSLRLFAMLGGVAMIVVSILGFIGKFVTLHWVNAIIAVYCLMLGIVMVMLEGRRIPFASSLETSLYKYALFLKYVWGRGILYFVGGTLEISSGGMLELIVGSFVAFVGIAFVVTGLQSAKKLRSIQSSQFSDATIQAEFADAAGGGSHLTLAQFKVLVQNLNVDLNQQELEASFMQVEKADRDQITYAEFKKWWDGIDHDAVV